MIAKANKENILNRFSRVAESNLIIILSSAGAGFMDFWMISFFHL